MGEGNVGFGGQWMGNGVWRGSSGRYLGGGSNWYIVAWERIRIDDCPLCGGKGGGYSQCFVCLTDGN